MIYGYIRVSADLQTTENQRFEIVNFTSQEGLTIDKWFEFKYHSELYNEPH